MKRFFRNILYLTAALSVHSAVSCRNEAAQQGPLRSDGLPDKQYITVTATLDPATKTSLDGLAVVWEAGDKVAISNEYSQYINELDINPEDVGKTTARFSGYADPADDCIIYPFGINQFTDPKCFQKSFRVTLPSTQSYRQNSFAKGANVAIGKTDDLKKPVTLINAGGLLKLKVKGSASVSKIELSSNSNSEFLAGDAYISKTFSTDVKPNFVNNGNLFSKLTLDCGTGVALTQAGTDFYFFLPLGTLSNGFIVQIYDTQGGSMTLQAAASASNKIQRSKILEMPAISYQSGNLPAKFIAKTTLGVYANCLTDPVLETAYLSKKVQAGVTKNNTNQIFSLKNWDDEWIVEFVLPATLASDAVYDIEVKPVIGTGSGFSAETLALKFLFSKDGLGWFVDTATGKGYIFNVM